MALWAMWAKALARESKRFPLHMQRAQRRRAGIEPDPRENGEAKECAIAPCHAKSASPGAGRTGAYRQVGPPSFAQERIAGGARLRPPQ